MKKLVVDTNALLRLLLDDVPAQVEKVKQTLRLARLGTIELVVPQIVLFEIEFHLIKLYRFNKDKVIDSLNVILSTAYLKIHNREIFILGLQLFKESKLSFVDCFLAGYAKDLEGEIFTFDKRLKKLTKSVRAKP